MSILNNPVAAWLSAIVVTGILLVGILAIGFAVVKGIAHRSQKNEMKAFARISSIPMATIRWEHPELTVGNDGLMLTGDAQVVEQDEDGHVIATHNFTDMSVPLPSGVDASVLSLEMILHSGELDSFGYTYGEGSRAHVQVMR